MTSKPDEGDFGGAGFEGDDMFARRERFSQNARRHRPHVVSEFVRRAIENTVGSMQSTGSLSRDALSYVLQQGDRGKRELVRIVANEVGEFLRGVDLSGEVVKVLTGVQLEVSARIRFKPSTDDKVSAEITDSQVNFVPTRGPAEATVAESNREDAVKSGPSVPAQPTPSGSGDD